MYVPIYIRMCHFCHASGQIINHKLSTRIRQFLERTVQSRFGNDISLFKAHKMFQSGNNNPESNWCSAEWMWYRRCTSCLVCMSEILRLALPHVRYVVLDPSNERFFLFLASWVCGSVLKRSLHSFTSVSTFSEPDKVPNQQIAPVILAAAGHDLYNIKAYVQGT